MRFKYSIRLFSGFVPKIQTSKLDKYVWTNQGIVDTKRCRLINRVICHSLDIKHSKVIWRCIKHQKRKALAILSNRKYNSPNEINIGHIKDARRNVLHLFKFFVCTQFIREFPFFSSFHGPFVRNFFCLFHSANHFILTFILKFYRFSRSSVSVYKNVQVFCM